MVILNWSMASTPATSLFNKSGYQEKILARYDMQLTTGTTVLYSYHKRTFISKCTNVKFFFKKYTLLYILNITDK